MWQCIVVVVSRIVFPAQQTISQHAIMTRFERVAEEGAAIASDSVERLQQAHALLSDHLKQTGSHLEQRAVELKELNSRYDTAVAQCQQIIKTVPDEVCGG